MEGLALRLIAVVALAGAALPSRATDYCIDAAAGSDTNSGLCPGEAWQTLGPSQSFSFAAGDRVLLSAGRYVHPLTAWYMTPGVSWIGAGAQRTTVVFNKPTQVPFVRFRTGSSGSGPPTDLRPQPFTATTVLSDMTIRNEGQGTVGIDVAITSGDSAPTLTRLIVERFPTGVRVHPSSDERANASTHVALTQSVIRGGDGPGVELFADVFYPRAVTEASTLTNVAVQAGQSAALVKTLVNDLRDAAQASSGPVLTNCTLRGGSDSSLLLVSYYNDGSTEARTSSNAGATPVSVRNSILAGSSRYGLEEWSAFNEPALVSDNALGGNAAGDYRDEGTTTRAAAAVGTGNVGDAPLFVDAAAGDLHVLPGSPTIDRIPAAQAPALDVDGHARPQGVSSDRGADEWVACGAVADASATALAPPCSGAPSRLDASRSSVGAACADGLLHEWWDGATLAGTGVTLDVSPPVDTTYALRVRCADPALSACSDEDAVLVPSSASRPSADAGSDLAACADDGAAVSFDLVGAASAVAPATVATVRWTAPEGSFADPSVLATRFTTTAGAASRMVVATLTVTDSAGCASSDDVVLALHPRPTVALEPVADQCVGTAPVDVTLRAVTAGGAPPFSYAWTASRGTVSGAADATLSVTPSGASETLDVSVTVTDARGCEATAAQVVRLVPGPRADAGADTDDCVPPGPVSVTLDGGGSTGVGTLSYRWTVSSGALSGAGSPVAQLDATCADAATTITATLEVTSDAGDCVSTDQRLVTLRPLPAANPGGPYTGLQGGGTTELALDGTASAGEPPLAFAWTTDLGTFLDTGTGSSALPSPTIAIPDAPVVQRARVCLVVSAGNGCASAEACTTAAALLVPVDPPLDPGPTLRVTKASPSDVRLEWQDAPTDATHDEALEYETWAATRGCGPFAAVLRTPRATGLHEARDPVLAAPPRFRCYFIRSVNDGGASVPGAPDGLSCR